MRLFAALLVAGGTLADLPPAFVVQNAASGQLGIAPGSMIELSGDSPYFDRPYQDASNIKITFQPQGSDQVFAPAFVIRAPSNAWYAGVPDALPPGPTTFTFSNGIDPAYSGVI